MPSEASERSDTDAPFVSADGINLSAPWRLGDFVREGPLTSEQVADLSSRFDLDPDDVRRLSRALNRVLDRELTHLAPMVLPTAIARGRRRVGKALRDMETARARLMAVQAQLKDLVTEDDVGTALMWGVNDGVHDCLQQLADALAKLEDVTRRPPGLYVLEPTDKRAVTDHRRDLVLMAVFHLWTRAGRRLTYTTDIQTSQRRGPLIEFANAVVACVTDPPSSLSGEMIVKGIRAFRHRNEAGSVSIGFSDDDWDTWTVPLASFRVTASPTDPADSPKISIHRQRDEWITPVHTWGRLDRRKRVKRDGAPDQETNDDMDDQTEPAP